MNSHDPFKASDNLRTSAREAECWIAHLNILSAMLEGRLRYYQQAAANGKITLPELARFMQQDLDNVESLHISGPIIP